jgi:uncharacterized protein (TIGR03437 family)
MNIGATAPGIFPAAQVLHSQPSDPQLDQVFLTLYGTGLRHSAAQGITCKVNGVNVPVLYFGAQPTYTGLDQINLQLPQGLAGTVQVQATVDGVDANLVSISIK